MDFEDKNLYELSKMYTPVPCLSLIISTLAIINKFFPEVCQLDVRRAFLNGTIDSEIYIEILEGIKLHQKPDERKSVKYNVHCMI